MNLAVAVTSEAVTELCDTSLDGIPEAAGDGWGRGGGKIVVVRYGYVALLLLVVAGCGNGTTTTQATATTPAQATTTVAEATEGCADVIGVEVSGDGPYTFSVTVSSADTGWDRYADQWRIETLDGDVLGTRELTHPHVDEQPFTRSLGGVEMTAPQTVVVAARDSVSGYCGETVEVDVG